MKSILEEVFKSKYNDGKYSEDEIRVTNIGDDYKGEPYNCNMGINRIEQVKPTEGYIFVRYEMDSDIGAEYTESRDFDTFAGCSMVMPKTRFLDQNYNAQSLTEEQLNGLQISPQSYEVNLKPGE